jgi:hypothetical protein
MDGHHMIICQEDFETPVITVASPFPKEHLGWLCEMTKHFSDLMIDDQSPQDLAQMEKMHAAQLENGSISTDSCAKGNL